MQQGANTSEASKDAAVPAGVQWLAFCIGVVVAVLGFKSALQDWRTLKDMTGLDAFVETRGTILKTGVRRDSSGDEDEYYPDLLYEYFVDGKSIWGWRLSYEEKPRERDYWRERTAIYPVGREVAVFHHPSKPKEAILEKKTDGLLRPVMSLAVGGAFSLIGTVLVVLPLAGLGGRLVRGR